jgi:polar amino acid transport system substrate-binding protein
MSKGSLVMGLETTFPPLIFTTDSGEVVGFEIDLANEVCNRLGVTLIEQPIVWEEKEDDLALNKIDCIWNGLSVTPSREKEMCLSEPYMENHIVFIVPADAGVGGDR